MYYVVVWDAELAAVAQAHADQCRFVHDCAQCRRVARWYVGQSLLRDKGESYQEPDWNFAVRSWFREIENYPVDNRAIYRYLILSMGTNHCNNYIIFRIVEGTGHFSQMIWADTGTVGCGMVTHISQQFPDKVTR